MIASAATAGVAIFAEAAAYGTQGQARCAGLSRQASAPDLQEDCLTQTKSWMAGTSLAMTVNGGHCQRPLVSLIVFFLAVLSAAVSGRSLRLPHPVAQFVQFVELTIEIGCVAEKD